MTAHAAHLAGVSLGLAGSGRNVLAAGLCNLRASIPDVTAIYWHFMDGLWIISCTAVLLEVRMANAHAEELRMTEWDGGVPPYSVGHKKLGCGCLLFRRAHLFGPVDGVHSVSTPTGRLCFIFGPASHLVAHDLLPAPSLTMVLGVNAAKRNDRAGTIKWICCDPRRSGVHGAALKEWFNLIHEGITLISNPWGVPQFGDLLASLVYTCSTSSREALPGRMAVGFPKGNMVLEHVSLRSVLRLRGFCLDVRFPLVYLLSVKMH
jgi:hypothetical protein